MDKAYSKKLLTPKSQDFSKWYLDVVLNAKLADYGPVRGTMVLRPYGYSLWEKVQDYFNSVIKKDEVKNAYFPSLIPISLLRKEKKHIEGFSPELAVITIGGGEKLEEEIVVRPTSETIIYLMLSKWISSWRDLPVKLNQWCNVVRWEKRTLPFLRTTEFLWQEGHTIHETSEEAKEMALRALTWYKDLYKSLYSLPVLIGVKSESEKFAGASVTYTVESLLPDGKALQSATSHILEQNFAKNFGVSYQDKEGVLKYPYPTSWGLSTRSLGSVVMIHGDDNGLILPPKLAPIKLVIIPVLGKDDEKVFTFSKKIKELLEKYDSAFAGSVELWDQDNGSFGWKVNESELMGIPLRITVGPKEVAGESPLTITCRVKDVESEEVSQKTLKEIGEKVEKMLEKEHAFLYEKAEKHLEENIRTAKNYEEFKNIMNKNKGFIKAFWCENPQCEAKIKEETKATTRLLPLGAKEESGHCIYCNSKAKHLWYFAQSS